MESTPDTSSAKRGLVTKQLAKTKSAAAKKPRASRKTPTDAPEKADVTIMAALLEPTAEDVESMIATAAYYLAAARNFSPGHELDDWLAAERVIHAKLYK